MGGFCLMHAKLVLRVQSNSYTNRVLFWESVFAGCFSLCRSLSLLLVSIRLFVSHSICLSVYLRLHTSLTIPQPSLENSKHETHILTDFCFCESVVSLSLSVSISVSLHLVSICHCISRSRSLSISLRLYLSLISSLSLSFLYTSGRVVRGLHLSLTIPQPSPKTTTTKKNISHLHK